MSHESTASLPIIRIVPEPRGARGVVSTNGMRFMIGDEEVRMVTRCRVDIEADQVLTATLDVAIEALDIEAHALLSMDTLVAAANHYGMRIVTQAEFDALQRLQIDPLGVARGIADDQGFTFHNGPCDA